MNLRQLSQELETAYELLNESTNAEGEVNEQALQLLNECKLPFEEKVEGYIEIRRRFKDDIDVLKAEEERLKVKRKRLEMAQERLENGLKDALKTVKMKKLKTKYCTIQIQASQPSLKILNLDEIPNEYKTIEQVIQVDKNAIKRDIKNGKKVQGIQLIQGTFLRID